MSPLSVGEKILFERRGGVEYCHALFTILNLIPAGWITSSCVMFCEEACMRPYEFLVWAMGSP